MKVKFLFPVNLHLFDGEGEGQGGTENSGAVNGSQPGSETVVYGKEIGTESNSTTSTTNNSSNTPGEEETTIDFSKITPEKRAEVYKQFKDNFKDEFSNDFQQHFDRRFKNHKEVESKIGVYEPIIGSLMKYHNVNDVQALQKIIDDDVLQELAEREGFSSVDKYKEYLDNQNKARLYDKKTQDEVLQKEKDTKINTWVEQGIELRKTFPEFDLSAEILNPQFASKLEAGLSVEEAYRLIHMDEIIKKETENAAKKAEENTVKGIQAKGNRIPENGTKPTPGVVRKTDPSKLTEKDMEEIAKRVSRGEKISF